MEERASVAIIGAGPAGLAVGACLRRAGLDFIMLEKQGETAPAWRGHYERLHLHTIRRLSSLPFMPFPASLPRYVPRKSVVQYLEAYAAHFDLRPRFGETVRSARREGGQWIVETTSTRVVASHLVVATGNSAEPVTPQIAGIDQFRGSVAHSAGYTNAAPYAGQSVLVIGMGNTGAEIALDLADAGARPVISVRSGVHIVPRELFGVPIQVVAMISTKLLPSSVNDRLFPHILDLALGDLKKYGIKRPEQGLLEQVARSSRIPVIDVGTVRRIKSGAIKIAPDIAEIDETGAFFSDGRYQALESIILATGYKPNYRCFLNMGEAAGHNGPTAQTPCPSLHFVGFHSPVTGLLRAIAQEAVQVAKSIRESPAP